MAEQSPKASSTRQTGISEPSTLSNPPDIDPTPAPTTDKPVMHPSVDGAARKAHEARNPAENRNAAAPTDEEGNRPETNDSRTEAHQYPPRDKSETQEDNIHPASGMRRGSDKDMNVVPPPGNGAKENEEKLKKLTEEGLKARNEAFKGGESKMG